MEVEEIEEEKGCEGGGEVRISLAQRCPRGCEPGLNGFGGTGGRLDGDGGGEGEGSSYSTLQMTNVPCPLAAKSHTSLLF